MINILIYSYLNASTGSNFAALLAGNKPETAPIKRENPITRMIT
jgi:hypothetical protein